MINAEQAQAIEREANELPLEIGFKRLSENATLPIKAHIQDSGFDLYAAEAVIVKPCNTVVIPTDIAIKLPKGYDATVRPRSGVTSKSNLRVQLGTIDNGYIGNIGIIADNIGTTAISISKGDRIAQLCVHPIPQTVAVEITELDESER